jgi:hypothetical protein
MIIWMYLKRHPELYGYQSPDYIDSVSSIMGKVRLEAYPYEKRKGTPYRAWRMEIFNFLYNWEELNLSYALWGKGQQKMKVKDNPWD